MTCVLLSIPAELFQQITHELVTDIGVVEAWKLRGVCRTFAAEVFNEIFSRQPEEVLQETLEKKFVRKNIGVYLTHVMKTSAGATGALMQKTKHLLNDITESLGIDQEQRRDEHARRLFQGLTSRLQAEEIADLIWPDKGHHPGNQSMVPWVSRAIRGLRGPITSQEQLAAAVSVGNCNIVEELFQRSLLQPIITSVFGGPWAGRRQREVSEGRPWAQPTIRNGNLLEIAAHQDDRKMIRTLIACYARCKVNVHSDLAAAIAYMIREGNCKTLRFLLSHWIQVKGSRANQNKCRASWLMSAANKASLAMIDAILDTKGPGTESLPRKEVRAIIQYGTPAVLRHYIAHGRIDPNKTWSSLTPLIISTKNDDCAMIQELLRAGADVNGAAGNGSTALCMACLNANLKAAAHLLRAGAGHDETKWPARYRTDATMRSTLLRLYASLK
ncbi:hypothetical protein PMIN07_002691 [Paraphaeosphaeria minitans]